MKGERLQYPKAKGLPPKAMTVKQYAEKRNFKVGHIYKMYKLGQAEGVYRIVDFCGINFVIEEKQKKKL